LAALAFTLWRSPSTIRSVVSVMRRWPAAIGVVAGCVWWAILAPAMLGPAIVALSLAALFKSRQLQLAARGSEAHSRASDATVLSHV
jgi:hypothetical protein